VTLRLANGKTPGTLALSWNGYGAQWKFTVESSDSLSSPSWSSVAPTNQWPSFSTNLIVTPAAAPIRLPSKRLAGPAMTNMKHNQPTHRSLRGFH
jgi:hypothetical protein